jgi:hypothetical protein
MMSGQNGHGRARRSVIATVYPDRGISRSENLRYTPCTGSLMLSIAILRCYCTLPLREAV